MRPATRFALAVLALAVVAAGVAQAQPAKPNGKGQVILSWDEFVKITGYDPTKKGGPQAVTIPWKEVQDLLGVKVAQVGKATVDLPWTEFKALLQWSIDRKAGKTEAPPPTDYIVSACGYAGQLTDDGATFTLKMKVDVLRKKGWTRIPVLPTTVAVTKATLGAGAYLNTRGSTYEILTEKSGAMDVELAFSVAVTKSAGINRVNFSPTVGASALLDVTIDRADVDVKVPGAQSLLTKTAAGKTQTAAALPGGAPVSVSWERALPKVAKVAPKLYAETRTLVTVAEGVLLCRETVYVNILHSPVRELKLSVPPGVSILEVSGSKVQDWRVDKAELVVVLSGEVVGSEQLRLAYEQPAKDNINVPVLRAVGVEREKGFVGVAALANVEISAAGIDGATAIDVRQLPADILAMTNQPILLGFRYVAEKFTIPLTVKKHEAVGVLVTIVDSALFTGMQLNDGRRMTKVIYSVRNNRNQFLRLQMPQADGVKTEIWSVAVSGNPVAPAKDEKGSVLIPLIRSKSGARELASFPVEIVYVETPAAVAPARGKLHVELPVCGVPSMHVMYSFYLPAEGRYTVGWGDSGFSGPLRRVKNFTAMRAGAGAEVVRRDVAGQVTALQKQVDQRVAAAAVKAGATPIRVRLPIDGTLFRLEKILALPQDRLYLDVQYRDWKVAK